MKQLRSIDAAASRVRLSPDARSEVATDEIAGGGVSLNGVGRAPNRGGLAPAPLVEASSTTRARTPGFRRRP